MITDNLAAALRRLRLFDQPRTLWVDAICINQADSVEKAQQVAQMADTYAYAVCVVAWLGEGDCKASLDVAEVADLAQRAEEIGLNVPSDHNRQVILRWVYGNKKRVDWLMSVPGAAAHANFNHLYESTWFTRMWVVQEALLAKRLTLYFGKDVLEWIEFQQLMVLLHSIEAATMLPMPNAKVFIKHAWSLVEVRQRWRWSSLQSSSVGKSDSASEISYLAHQLRRRSCKDDRDRVFALRGLVLCESERSVIQPDYTKDCVQVYTELARDLLRLGNVGILYDAGLWKRKGFQIPKPKVSQHQETPAEPWANYLPTWAPDYRPSTTYMEANIRFGGQFERDPSELLSIDLSMEPYTIRTQASLIDIITFVQPANFIHDARLQNDDIAMFLSCRQFIEDLQRSFNVHFQDGRHYPIAEEDPLIAFAHALMGGTTHQEYKKHFAIQGDPDECPDPSYLWKIYQKCCLDADGETYHAVIKEAETRKNSPQIKGLSYDFYSDLGTESGIVWQYHQYLVSIFRHHCFFISDDGYIGLAPRNTQPLKDTSTGGDVLAFINGANVPFVLRDHGDEVDGYALVGPCYIYGLMKEGELKKHKERYVQGTGTIQII